MARKVWGVLERVREFAIRLLQPRHAERPDAAARDMADLSVVELIAGGHVPEAVVEHLRSENDRARVTQEAMLRAIADGEDVRRRLTEQKEQAVRFANEHLLREMLPVLDNLELSLQYSDAESPSPLREAMEMTLRQWYAVFERAGAVRIDAERGGEFDPAVHEVVMEEPDAALPEGSIARIIQTGLRVHERVLRPTRVSLSTGKPATAPKEVAATADQETPGGGAAQGGGESLPEPPAGPKTKPPTAPAREPPVSAPTRSKRKAKAKANAKTKPKPKAKPKARRRKAARSRQRSPHPRAGRG